MHFRLRIVTMMLISRVRHVQCLVNSIVLRNLSSESTRTAKTAAAEAPINDRDTFGTLSTSGRRALDIELAVNTIPEDPDGYGHKVEFDIEARKNAYYYKYEISKYARQGGPGLRKALELFQEMKSKARLEPTMDNFSPLIYGCAKAGYTKRAFDLYNESNKYLVKPSNSMITCLINACAESPFPEYGIERLKWFLTHIKVNYNRQLNEIQYNSAIKAYGKLGQLEEASKLVQEMLDNDITPTVDTFNMLLIGCASNQQAGCSIALRVFKRLKMYQYKPTTVTYRLFLRCIRDCGMGSPELIEQTLRELPAMTSLDQRLKYKSSAKRHQPKRADLFDWVPLLSDIGRSLMTAISEPPVSTSDLSLQVVGKKTKANIQPSKRNMKGPDGPSELLPQVGSNSLQEELVLSAGDVQQTLPNLLSDDHLDLMIRIRSLRFDKLRHGWQRLSLFGGFYSFLDAMMRDGCKPDSKTFTLILDCLPATRENYLYYFKLAGELEIKRDLLFYDLLIRHICKFGLMKARLGLALNFVEQMHIDNLRPNISTFESLASGCDTWSKAKQLLNDVDNCGFVISDVMIAKFFERAIRGMNFHYLNQMIDYCNEKKFQPNKHLTDKLEDLRLKASEMILMQEKGQPHDDDYKVVFDEKTVATFDMFQSKLKRWLGTVELKNEDHPWSQFNVETGSKRDGLTEYEKHFRAMERAKKEAMQKGCQLGNLAYKAKRIVEAQAQ